MLEAILKTLQVMGWLGVIFLILILTNTVAGTLSNVWSGEETFSWKKMVQGVLKALVFLGNAILIAVAFTMFPYINEMITGTSGAALISDEALNTLSSVGILSVVISAIVIQGKKAIKNILKLANMSTEIEKIT